MKYLLDTNAIIALARAEPALMKRIRKNAPTDFGIPALVAHELYYGAFKSREIRANLARVESLTFAVVDFDREDAREASEIRAALASRGLPIGPYDVLIAGQARSRNLVLISRNVREFARVPGLRTESW